MSCSPYRVPIARVAAAQAALAARERRQLRVAVVAEYYPRPSRSRPGASGRTGRRWRSGSAASTCACWRSSGRSRRWRRCGALPRPGRCASGLARLVRQPAQTVMDGIEVRYVRFFSPPRPLELRQLGALGGAAAAPRARPLSAEWQPDLDPRPLRGARGRRGACAGSSAAASAAPLVVSVHGGDLSYAAPRSERGRRAVRRTLRRRPTR